MAVPASNKKILAIDDMKTLRDLLSRTLKSGGHTVMEAIDGVDGLTKFDEFKPDLVISDLNMPNLDGIGFVEGARKRAHGQSIPILILTTETNEALKLKAREAGATGWLTKPFNPERLLKLINQLSQ
jgi:two-component system, chemotaxis family, chemotaxis protein CheY